MAANITVTYPPATGVPAPPTELKFFGNESASTKDSMINYKTTTLPTTPASSYVRYRDQVIKGIVEYPR